MSDLVDVNAILNRAIEHVRDESERYSFAQTNKCAVAKLYEATTGNAPLTVSEQVSSEEFCTVLADVCERLGVEKAIEPFYQWWLLSDFVADFQDHHEGMNDRQAAVGVFQAALT